MSSLTEYITTINTRLQQLLKQHEHLQKENASQAARIRAMETQLQNSIETAETLVQQNLLLKASVTEMNPTDKKALEQKIQHYIKNIDRCIAILSQ